MPRLLKVLLYAALCLAAAPISAEMEDGLYGAALPPDAVFLRRIGSETGDTTAFGRSFSLDDLPEATYAAISAAALDGAVAGGHYTITTHSGDADIIAEPARTDPAKVYLFLLNTGDAPARLTVADGGPEVIAETAPGQIAERAVNPLAVSLTVESDGISKDFEVVLRHGVNLTFIVEDGSARLIENRFGPVIAVD